MTGLRLRASARLPLLLAVILLAAYALTAPPNIVVGDSPELITTIHTLGVCHPPGYPFYHLVGKLLTLVLWFLPVARSCNLLSSLAAVGAILAGYYLLADLGVRRWTAALGLAALALSRVFWHFSIVTEVYTLNLLFFSLQVWLVATWNRQATWGRFYLLALLMGLSLAHHTTIAIYFPLYLVVLALQGWRLGGSGLAAQMGEHAPGPQGFGAGVLARAGVVFLAPLLFYLYLPLAASRNPPMDWGTPSTLGALLDHITVRQYHHLLFQYGWRGYLDGLHTAVITFARECHVFLAFVPLGCLALARRGRREVLALVGGSIAINFVFSSAYDIVDIEPYFLPGIFGIYFLAIVGIDGVFQWVKIRRASAASLGMVGALLCMNLVVNLPQCNLSRSWTAHDFGMEVLRSLESGKGKPAVLFVRGDEMSFITLYLSVVEKRRPDVVVIADNFILNRSPGPVNPDNFEIYYSAPTADALPGYKLIPWGLVYRVVRGGDTRTYGGFDNFIIRGITDRQGKLRLDDATSNLAGIYYYQQGGYFLTRNDRASALTSFEKAAEVNSKNPNTLYNLGLIYEEIGEWQRALEAYSRVAAARSHTMLAKLCRNRIAFSSFMLSEYDPAYPEVRWAKYGVMLYNNAVLSEDLGLAQSAIAALERAISINPGYFEAYFTLGNIYSTLKQYKEAYSYFKKASQLDPNDPIVRQRLEDLERVMGRRAPGD